MKDTKMKTNLGLSSLLSRRAILSATTLGVVYTAIPGNLHAGSSEANDFAGQDLSHSDNPDTSWENRSGTPKPIGIAPPNARVAAIRHHGDSYFITTEDGRETSYWEKNIRLKIDSDETGPPAGVPVIVGACMQGDRYSVIFASLADLQRFISKS